MEPMTAQTIGSSTPTAANAAPAAFRIAVQGNAAAGEGITHVEVVKLPCTIGRSRDNDVQIDHPSVSRHHARLEMGADGPVLIDLGSTNGTFVGDDGRDRLAPHGSRLWPVDSLARVGQRWLRLDRPGTARNGGAARPAAVGLAGTAVVSPARPLATTATAGVVQARPAMVTAAVGAAVGAGVAAGVAAGDRRNGIKVSVQPAVLIPGEWANVDVKLVNTGSVAQHVRVGFDLPAHCTLEDGHDSPVWVEAGASVAVRRTIRSEADTRLEAGTKHVAVNVYDANRAIRLAEAKLPLTVRSFGQLTAKLERDKLAQGNPIKVVLENHSNENKSVELSFFNEDAGAKLDFKGAPLKPLDVLPGMTERVTVTPSINGPFYIVGGERAHAFSVRVRPTDGAESTTLSGHVTQAARLAQSWTFPVIFASVAMAAVVLYTTSESVKTYIDDTIALFVPVSTDQRLLGGIDLTFAELLDKGGAISDQLRDEWPKSSKELSSGATVSVVKLGNSWVIEDGETQYFVRREGEALNVYVEVVPPTATPEGTAGPADETNETPNGSGTSDSGKSTSDKTTPAPDGGGGKAVDVVIGYTSGSAPKGAPTRAPTQAGPVPTRDPLALYIDTITVSPTDVAPGEDATITWKTNSTKKGNAKVKIDNKTVCEKTNINDSCRIESEELHIDPNVGFITLTVEVAEGVRRSATRDVDVNVVKGADPDIKMSVTGKGLESNGKVAAGTDLIYKLLIVNDGARFAQGVTVIDTLPTGVTLFTTNPFNSEPAGIASLCVPSGTESGDLKVTCETFGIEPFKTAAIEIKVTVGASLATEFLLENKAEVRAKNAVFEAGTGPDDKDTQSLSLNVVRKAELGVSLEVSGSFVPGHSGGMKHTIKVTNSGPSDVDDVDLTDTLPTGTSLMSPLQDYKCGEITPTGFMPDVVWRDLKIPAHTSTTCSLNVLVASSLESVAHNVFVNSEACSVKPCARATPQTVLEPESELRITPEANPSEDITVTVGSKITYTIVVTNDGPSDVTGASVTVDFAKEKSVQISAPPVDCSWSDPSLTCSRNITTSTPSTINVEVTTLVAGSLKCSATVFWSDSRLPGSHSKAASVTHTVE